MRRDPAALARGMPAERFVMLAAVERVEDRVIACVQHGSGPAVVLGGLRVAVFDRPTHVGISFGANGCATSLLTVRQDTLSNVKAPCQERGPNRTDVRRFVASSSREPDIKLPESGRGPAAAC